MDYKRGQKHGPDNERWNKKENIRQSNARHGLASIFDINEKQETEVPECQHTAHSFKGECRPCQQIKI